MTTRAAICVAILALPKNVAQIFLPPRSPELNPAEQIWQHLRSKLLSKRVFETHTDIVAAACNARRAFVETLEVITSIGMRDRARIGQELGLWYERASASDR